MLLKVILRSLTYYLLLTFIIFHLFCVSPSLFLTNFRFLVCKNINPKASWELVTRPSAVKVLPVAAKHARVRLGAPLQLNHWPQRNLWTHQPLGFGGWLWSWKLGKCFIPKGIFVDAHSSFPPHHFEKWRKFQRSTINIINIRFCNCGMMFPIWKFVHPFTVMKWQNGTWTSMIDFQGFNPSILGGIYTNETLIHLEFFPKRKPGKFGACDISHFAGKWPTQSRWPSRWDNYSQLASVPSKGSARSTQPLFPPTWMAWREKTWGKPW